LPKIIEWLTGFDNEKLQEQIDGEELWNACRLFAANSWKFLNSSQQTSLE